MQVLFFFLKNILQDLAGFPMDKTSLLLPSKETFQKKTGYRPQNETIPCFMIHLFVSAAAAQLDPQGTSQEGRRIEPTAKANKHSKRKVPNRLPTKQEDGNDGKRVVADV